MSSITSKHLYLSTVSTLVERSKDILENPRKHNIVRGTREYKKMSSMYSHFDKLKNLMNTETDLVVRYIVAQMEERK